MSFYKDLGGFVLFILCHIVFILQFLLIYEMNDVINNKQNIVLIIHKIIYYFFFFLTIISYIKTSLIDPGTISNDNNREIIEFYYFIHKPFIKWALYITEKKTPEVMKKIILGNSYNQQNQEIENEDEEENDSDKDYFNFKRITSINNEMKKKLEKDYYLKLSRCINCFAIRPINSHHCTICHKCFIEQDHHCPWVNNCIGLFNKKYFILFLFYGSVESLYSNFLFFYYTLYKNMNDLIDNVTLLVLDIFAIIFGLILTIISILLLWDQYDTMEKDCAQCDFKKGILLEKSSVRQQFQIYFGRKFSYKWFFPFYPGGNIDLFLKKDYLKLNQPLKNKNENKNENKSNIENGKSKID